LIFVEVVGCCNRLIINLSGSFLIIAVDDQEVEDFGDGNKIISGEDER
jgi:hypothetical protein